MQDISEKVSYLQGLSEGLSITEGSPQGKIISGILNVLNEMADEIGCMQRDFTDMQDYIQSMDDDLMDLEKTVVEDEFTEIECQSCGEALYVETDILEDEDVIEIICPNCHEIVYVHDGAFDYQPTPIGDDYEERH